MVDKFYDDEGNVAVITSNFNQGWFTDDAYRTAYGEKILFDVTLVKLFLSERLMSTELWHLRYYNMDTEPLEERKNVVISQIQEHIKTNYPIIPLNIVYSLTVQWVKKDRKFTIMMDSEFINEDIFYYDEHKWIEA